MVRHLRIRNTRRGQALPEFALVVPILALIFLSIVQMAFILAAQIGITNAVREAARLAATSTPTTTVSQATTNGSGVYGALTNTSTGLLKKNVMAYASSNLVTSGSPITEVCYSTFTDQAGNSAVNVKVEAYYRHPLFIPLLGAIIDSIDGTSDGAFRVGASEEMRVENETLTTNPGLTSCTSS
jgi:Flp pilus assembly protein TadG